MEEIDSDTSERRTESHMSQETTGRDKKLEPLSTYSTTGVKGNGGWEKMEGLSQVVAHKDLIKG